MAAGGAVALGGAGGVLAGTWANEAMETALDVLEFMRMGAESFGECIGAAGSAGRLCLTGEVGADEAAQ